MNYVGTIDWTRMLGPAVTGKSYILNVNLLLTNVDSMLKAISFSTKI